jgi:hypothetical protein
MDAFRHFLTRENITLFVAIFGAVGTLATWIYAGVTSRKALRVQLLHVYKPGKSLICYFSFINLSRLPICVQSVHIVIDDKMFSCVDIPHSVYSIEESFTLGSPRKYEFCSLALPVNLSGLGGSSGLLDFDIPQEYLEKLSTSLSFSVSTNRGGLKKMTQLFEGYSDMDELL